MGFLKDHSFFIAVIGSAALIVTVYHCLLSIFCHPRQQQPQDVEQQQEDTDVGQIDVRQNIPVYKFITGKSPSGECPVCLSEFEDGEELRVLPKCLHSFHVVCIDKWLHSHPNCPTCRTDAMSIPPLQVVGAMDSGSNVGRSGILVSSISPDLEAQQQTSVG